MATMADLLALNGVHLSASNEEIEEALCELAQWQVDLEEALVELAEILGGSASA